MIVARRSDSACFPPAVDVAMLRQRRLRDRAHQIDVLLPVTVGRVALETSLFKPEDL
jgi:hypothetical protein